MTSTITIPIDQDTSDALAKLSRQRACTQAHLAQQVLREFVALQAWQMEAIDEGVHAADQGRLIDHQDLKRRWESKLGNQVD